MSALTGTRVRFVWPDGSLADARGEIVHVSRGDGERVGLLVRWQEGAHPRETYVSDPSWLVTEDGCPLVIPPRTERVSVAGGVL